MPENRKESYLNEHWNDIFGRLVVQLYKLSAIYQVVLGKVVNDEQKDPIL